MKKNTSYTIRRVQRLPVILIGEWLLVGAAAGVVVMLYRIALTYAGQWLGAVLDLIEGRPVRIALWFLVLCLFAVIVGRLVKWEPMISGSGIPQAGSQCDPCHEALCGERRTDQETEIPAGGGILPCFHRG